MRTMRLRLSPKNITVDLNAQVHSMSILHHIDSAKSFGVT
jgi:hypothetical protein